MVCRFNSILQDHYLLMVWLDTAKVAVWFTWSWIQNIVSLNWEDVYRVHAIYVEPCDTQCPPQCMNKEPTCNPCCENLYSLEIYEAIWDLTVWAFAVNNNKISFNVWEWIQKWYVVYSKWARTINSLDDSICFEPTEIRLLKQTIMKTRMEYKWDYEAANYFEKLQFKALEQLRMIEDRLPHSIQAFAKRK